MRVPAAQLSPLRAPAWVAVLAAAALVGCGGDGGSQPGEDAGADSQADAAPPDGAAAQPCADMAKAICGEIQKCSPFILSDLHGDMATCVARRTLACQLGQGLPGASATAASLDACAAATAAESCADDLGGVPPDACRASPGAVADGNACGVDAQCQSTGCEPGASSGCGTCVARVALGQDCTGAPCEYGLRCSPNGTCVQPGALNASCDNLAAPCRLDLVCDQGNCAQPAAEGAPCSAQGGSVCSFSLGLFCNTVTSKCAKIALAPPGQACGYDAKTGALTECSGGAQCSTLASAGTCSTIAADGQPCGGQTGATCLYPATCQAAKCTLPDLSVCK